jgi:hypothetical protein
LGDALPIDVENGVQNANCPLDRTVDAASRRGRERPVRANRKRKLPCWWIRNEVVEVRCISASVGDGL